MEKVKITIIGAGVSGLSIAYELSQSHSDIIVVEKNETFGQESSSRNSEVIHAGLYYRPGSLKAQTCVKGNRLLYEFCAQHNIPHKRLGKLVVATDDEGIQRIEKDYSNAIECGVKNLRFLDPGQIKKLEPDVRAKKGFFSPDTGILDTHSLMHFLYVRAKERGVTFSFSTEVVGVEKKDSLYKITVSEPQGDAFSFESEIVINCAGLCSDKIASMVGIDIDKSSYRLNYCKGQYFRIQHPKKFSISHLIYPPSTQISLGIHITPDLGEGIRLGPDAKYVSQIDYNVNEEDKSLFYESVKKYLGALELDDLIPDTAGVRPKLQKEGEGFHDFIIREEADKGFDGFINLIGIESPGLTSCLAIAEIVKRLVVK
jgi:L-2-hydroxyglutarate oxidase LhgO